MDGQKPLDGLELEQHLAFHDDVGAVAGFQPVAMEFHRDGHLSFRLELPFPQAVQQAAAVGAFEQSWAECAMYLDGAAQDFMRQLSCHGNVHVHSSS